VLRALLFSPVLALLIALLPAFILHSFEGSMNLTAISHCAA
jgi:hypothetical protein